MATDSNNYVISYYTLRKLIGKLAILLPFLCLAVNMVVNNFDLLNNPLLIDDQQMNIYTPDGNLKSSISHFYYTASGPLFVGFAITVSVFLFCYIGYRPSKKDDKFAWLTDNRVTSFAAICLLGVVIFPTGSEKPITDNVHIFVSSKTAGMLHLFCAGLFFLAMSVLSIINFRRHPGKVFIKDAEGTLYLICGWGIIGCLVVLGITFFAFKNVNWIPYCFVYIMEVAMLILFGTAWLVKGKSKPTEYVLRKLNNQQLSAKSIAHK